MRSTDEEDSSPEPGRGPARSLGQGLVQRILVRLGVSRDIASLLLDDLRGAVDHFSRHPVTVPMSKQESGGFSHA